MGYRALLKQYIQQLRGLVGDDFVEEIAKNGSLSKRELGELRTIVAELQRQSHRSESSQPGSNQH